MAKYQHLGRKYQKFDPFSKIRNNAVAKALHMYVPQLKKTAPEKWRKEFDYTAFHECIGRLLDDSNIHIDFRRRKLDHFLWYTHRK